ncbi:Holliday junction ATP-dependent DNA helicase RuvA [bioreactor metagenome]|uniref:Holliday junction ATP-dependent DNA helicase RuvA n=1 Tax=bioreactor metagenome TaxID=1076179 RepID=A0A645EJ18_9ZZZZ
MISSLKGKIDRVSGDYIEIEVGGVGYLVFMGKKNYQLDDEIKIYTYMAVSENEIALYGFENWEDVNLFKMLISVSGVGPKTGAQILAGTKSDLVIKAIGNADVDFFQKIKGIGKKTAQRIIIDLKSKIGGLGELDLAADEDVKEDELWMSLKQLGFDKKEIEKVIKKLPTEIVIIEEKISWCLQNLN